MSHDKNMRVDLDFVKFVDDVINERRKAGKDKKDQSFRRITKAVSRVPRLSKILKEADIAD